MAHSFEPIDLTYESDEELDAQLATHVYEESVIDLVQETPGAAPEAPEAPEAHEAPEADASEVPEELEDAEAAEAAEAAAAAAEAAAQAAAQAAAAAAAAKAAKKSTYSARFQEQEEDEEAEAEIDRAHRQWNTEHINNVQAALNTFYERDDQASAAEPIRTTLNRQMDIIHRLRALAQRSFDFE